MSDHSIILDSLCGDDLSTEDISCCNGNLNIKCMKSKYCCINHLSNQQVQYILSDIATDIYLNACPGSGKTEVLGVKSAYEIKRWTAKNNGIAILTFTNSAENELRDRVTSYMGSQIGYPHFLGTFTSWVHGYIANPFLRIVTGYRNMETLDHSIRVIDNDCSSGFLNAYKTKYSYGNLGKIKANEFNVNMKTAGFTYSGNRDNGQDILDDLLNQDSWREKELTKVKQKFWKAGFVTYEDVEILVHKLLHENQDIAKYVAKRFPIIMIDECQDLSFSQLQIIKELNTQGTKIQLIGDLNQSIYEFRNIIPEDTEKFISELQMDEYKLTKNYRSCDAIVTSSMSVLCKTKDSEGKRLQSVKIPLIALLYQNGEEQQVLESFISLIVENQLDMHESRVIVRGHGLRQKLRGRRSSNKTINIIEDFAHSIYLHNGTGNVEDYQLSIQLLSRAMQKSFFSDSVHANVTQLYKPENVDNIEWRELLIKVQNHLHNTEELNDINITWSKWKAILQKTIDVSFISTNQCISGKTMNIGRIRQGNRQTLVKDTIVSANDTKIQCSIETIHSCKGMSLDAVLFMSTYRKTTEKNGAYWSDWFATDGNICESNRLAYVAFTRAKQLLVLGIPSPRSSPLDESQRAVLANAGFEIVAIN